MMSPAGCRTRGSEVRVPAELCAWWQALPAEAEIPAEPPGGLSVRAWCPWVRAMGTSPQP